MEYFLKKEMDVFVNLPTGYGKSRISQALQLTTKPCQTMTYKTRKTVNRLERKHRRLLRKQLHFYQVVPERPQEE